MFSLGKVLSLVHWLLAVGGGKLGVGLFFLWHDVNASAVTKVRGKNFVVIFIIDSVLINICISTHTVDHQKALPRLGKK